MARDALRVAPLGGPAGTGPSAAEQAVGTERVQTSRIVDERFVIRSRGGHDRSAGIRPWTPCRSPLGARRFASWRDECVVARKPSRGNPECGRLDRGECCRPFFSPFWRWQASGRAGSGIGRRAIVACRNATARGSGCVGRSRRWAERIDCVDCEASGWKASRTCVGWRYRSGAGRRWSFIVASPSFATSPVGAFDGTRRFCRTCVPTRSKRRAP